jgi:hypothetical protein
MCIDGKTHCVQEQAIAMFALSFLSSLSEGAWDRYPKRKASTKTHPGRIQEPGSVLAKRAAPPMNTPVSVITWQLEL